MADGAAYTEAGVIGAGFVAIVLAIIKTCGSKGLYCRTPCGSAHDCIVDLNDGRPTVDGTSPPNTTAAAKGGDQDSIYSFTDDVSNTRGGQLGTDKRMLDDGVVVKLSDLLPPPVQHAMERRSQRPAPPPPIEIPYSSPSPPRPNEVVVVAHQSGGAHKHHKHHRHKKHKSPNMVNGQRKYHAPSAAQTD